MSARLKASPARVRPELTYWHREAVRMFARGADTQGIARALGTTEADAYNLLAQARADRRPE
jgi:hypothetical protein